MEREHYLKDENFLDYVRDFHFAPDAEYQPHGRYARDVLDWSTGPKKMILWPRGSFKSSVFGSGYVGWLINRNPDIRILYASETAKQAGEHVGLVKAIFESPRHIEVFGEHEIKIGWTQTEFTSGQRKRELKEPTLCATGMEQTRTGMHWDLVLCDDIVGRENTKTPESIQNTWMWLGETLAQLDPGARLLYLGTPHHFFDASQKIQKDPELRKMFRVSVYAYRNPYPDGELFFPSRLTEDYVQSQRIMMKDTYLWSAFYLCRPQSESDQLFKEDQFHTINDYEIPLNCFTTILTDFASGENKDNDRTALFAVALDAHRTAYVLEARVGRWLPKRAIREALELFAKYQHRFCKGITIEKTAHTEWAKAMLEEERRSLGIRPPIIEIGGRSKETKIQRIQGLHGRFQEGGRIFWAESIRKNDLQLWQSIQSEFCEFPFSQHDDIPDAISDLDKQRDGGGYYVPAPPVGFNQAKLPGANRYKPTLKDGAYNPEKVAEFDLAELIRNRDQSGEDLWQRNSDQSQRSRQQDSSPKPGSWPF